MTDYGKIVIVGVSSSELRAKLAELIAWGGRDLPVWVSVGTKEKLDSIDNLNLALDNNLAEYIDRNFGSKSMIVKSGGNDDLYLVPDYDHIESDKFRKIRKKVTNYTPKKKRR